MWRRSGAALTVALAILAGACSQVDPVLTDVGSPGPPSTLTSTSWTVISVDGVAPVAETPSADFDGVSVSGDAGCNGYSATYSYDPSTGQISFGPASTTKRACGVDRSNTEARFLAALRVVNSATITASRRLTLAGPGATIELFQVATFASH